MKYELVLNKNNNDLIFDIDTLYFNSLCMDISNIGFNELLNNRDYFEDSLRTSLYLLTQFCFKSERLNDVACCWKYFYDNYYNLLDKVDYIRLNFNDNVLEFLDKYPVLRDKNIVLNEVFGMDSLNRVKELMNTYKDYPNIYAKFKNDIGYTRLDNCIDVINKIRKQGDYIRSLGLSELEEITYVYDLVRDRYYIEEENNDYCQSRDLYKILNSKYIVCEGYSNYFSALLDTLDIDNEVLKTYFIEKSDSAHTRNVIKVDDDKYDVHGHYLFDVTFGARQEESEENREFLRHYEYFLKTYGEFMVYNPFDFYWECYSLDDIMKMISLYSKSKAVDAETFLRLVSNVRYLNYLLDSNKYPYSVIELNSIYKNSKFDRRDSSRVKVPKL